MSLSEKGALSASELQIGEVMAVEAVKAVKAAKAVKQDPLYRTYAIVPHSCSY